MIYSRLFKNQARKAYEQGTALVVVPCKFRPDSPWGFSYHLKKSEHPTDMFDDIINNFTFYNCVYETGYYPAFYVQE